MLDLAIGIHTISRIPIRIAPYLRFRHTRGHGIHSPFVYGLVRNALMLGSGSGRPGGELYDALRSCGLNRRRAAQLQNLHNYCEYRRAGIFTAPADRDARKWPGEASVGKENGSADKPVGSSGNGSAVRSGTKRAKRTPEESEIRAAVRWLADGPGNGTLRVFIASCPVGFIREEAVRFRAESGAAIVVSPRADGERQRLCAELSAAGDCISIDNRGFMLYIYGSGLTPRHYKL